MKYDVAIIGGGLAGLSLAIQCADHNISAVLFEKEEYPFHKVCGEYISMESWNFITRLGLDLEALQLPLINQLNITDIKGAPHRFKLPLGGFGISRYLLDHSLYHIALKKGATIHTNTKVNDVSFINDEFIIKAGSIIVTSKVTTSGYGKRSNLDIKMNREFIKKKEGPLNNYIGVKYHVLYDNHPKEIALHNFHNGYCGISKIEENKSCLCYLTTADNLRKSGNSIQEMQQKVLYKNPNLKEIFTNASFMYQQPITISQISFNKKTLVEDHILMTGDAAGMISPLCGNGMSMALHSSKLAFEAIDLFLNRKGSRQQMEHQYINEWNNKFSKRLWVGRSVQRIFGGNRSTSLFLKTMKLIPPLANAIIKSTHGKPF